MKKLYVLALLVFLTGCASEQTFETVEDWYYTPAISQGVLSVSLPEDAAVQTHSESGSIYLCDGYSICLQTLEAGDLDATLRSISGFSSEQLQIIQTRQQELKRYDFVWAAAGEAGDTVCRAAILDDGYFHYTLSVSADAAQAEGLESCWQELFASFTLGSAD